MKKIRLHRSRNSCKIKGLTGWSTARQPFKLVMEAMKTEIYAAYQNVTSISELYATLFQLDKIVKNKQAYLFELAFEKRQNKLRIQSDVAWLQKLLVYVRSE
ncbi:hypothetical protein [Paenibacillus sp. KS-LC4]|uniref:hypothetical protein n=1 Tax=Paenibacillus sp. KS-LC4 TaxID=2979727 RepID=UPI0030D244EF